mgnify:FL=1
MTRVEHNYYRNGGGTYHMDVIVVTYHMEGDVEVVDNLNQIYILLNPTEPAIIEENMEWESHKLIIETWREDASKISKYANYLATSTDFNIDNILNAINS